MFLFIIECIAALAILVGIFFLFYILLRFIVKHYLRITGGYHLNGGFVFTDDNGHKHDYIPYANNFIACIWTHIQLAVTVGIIIAGIKSFIPKPAEQNPKYYIVEEQNYIFDDNPFYQLGSGLHVLSHNIRTAFINHPTEENANDSEQ